MPRVPWCSDWAHAYLFCRRVACLKAVLHVAGSYYSLCEVWQVKAVCFDITVSCKTALGALRELFLFLGSFIDVIKSFSMSLSETRCWASRWCNLFFFFPHLGVQITIGEYSGHVLPAEMYLHCVSMFVCAVWIAHAKWELALPSVLLSSCMHRMPIFLEW